MANKLIYLDNAATTYPHKNIIESFEKFIELYPGNPGSIHKLGQEATRLLDKSRNLIMSTLNIHESEVIFTSSATEANNLALKGVCHAYPNRGKHIIISEIEHPAVIEVAKELERDFGYRISYVKIKSDGSVDLDHLQSLICDDTLLVSIMAVNNEIGSINDISAISKMLKNYPKIIFHVDAVQALGKIPFDYNAPDLLTIAGHKIHAFVGCGCLIKKNNINLRPVIDGGGQEDGYRSSTVSLPLSATLALAVKDAINEQPAYFKHSMPLAQRLVEYLASNHDLYEINSNYEKDPFLINFSLKNRKASVVVEALSEENIMVSSVSACHSNGEPISYVVMALKHDEKLAHNTIRVSFGDQTTLEEVETFITSLDRIVRSIKQ